MTDNTLYILTRFVKELKIPVTNDSIIAELEKHPNYGSMLAFSEVLNGLQVPNGAYELNFDQLNELPFPFIAFVKKKEFIVVHKLNEDEVIVTNEYWKRKSLTITAFKSLYSGSVLIAEKDEVSGEADYGRKHFLEKISQLRIPALIAGVLFLLTGYLFLHPSFFTTISINTFLLLLVKTTGVATSIMLLIQSIDQNNSFIQKICGDKDQNCGAILNSKAAKVTDFLSWSEVGFFYFSGTWLVLLFNSTQPVIIQTLAIINLLCLPYTVYSIYHQWKVAGQWCIFCCIVQALLWLEFFSFLPYLNGHIQLPSLKEVISFSAGMLVPVLLWVLVKPYMLVVNQLTPLKEQLRRFKYNTDYFEKMLNDEVKYALPDAKNSLIIGNHAAEKVITMVANPYCAPCAETHKALHWLENRSDIKLQIIFSTPDNEKDRKTIVASHFLSLNNTNGGTTLKKAIYDWYEQQSKNYDSWSKGYPVSVDYTVKEQLSKQREWCRMTGITNTPTLFFNGRRLPEYYRGEDLKYFI